MTSTLARLHSARKERLRRFASRATPDTRAMPREPKPPECIPSQKEVVLADRDAAWVERQLALHPPLKKLWFYVAEDLGRSKYGPSIETIQRAVLTEYPGATLKGVNSATITPVLVRPRQIAMYLARSLTPRSFPDIGRRFGGRDHTTVIHAVNKISGLIKSDPELAEQIERIKGSLEVSA